MSNLSDIEQSLNAIVYIDKHHYCHSQIPFLILETENNEYKLIIDGKLIHEVFYEESLAFQYATGYIDGALEYREKEIKIREYINKISQTQYECPPEFQKMIDEKFDELLA